MEWQLIAVVGLLAAAGAYLSRAAWRTWFGAGGKAGCASACGGCAKPADVGAADRRRIALPQV